MMSSPKLAHTLLIPGKRSWTLAGSRAFGGVYIVEYGLALLIDKACEKLLRIPEHQRPSEDLRGCIECGETWDKLAAHEQQAEESGDRAGWELERGECNGQAMPLR